VSNNQIADEGVKTIDETPQRNLKNSTKESNSSSTGDISMMVLGGFIAVLGIAAVAIAFTLLNAATLGIAGLVVAGVGVVATLAGVGLFASGARNKSQPDADSSIEVTLGLNGL
jgi:uncharacterized RDD family membrane protein YckC